MSFLNKLLLASILLTATYLVFFPSTSQAVLALALVLLACSLRYSQDKQSQWKLPPGPKGIPIFGILPWLIFEKPYVYVANLQQKYGPIIKIGFGKVNVIFVNDYELCKVLGQHGDFLGRPNFGFLHEFSNGLGLVNTEGTVWKHQRRFMVHALKDSGMGKLQLQEKIQDELSRVLAELDKNQGHPFSIRSILEKSTCNIICALAFNKQFAYDDPDLLQRMHNLEQNFRLLEYLQILKVYWWSRPLTWMMERTVYKNAEEFRVVGQKLITDHSSTLDPDNPRDLIDLFLMEMMKKKSTENDEYLSTFTEDQLNYTIMDLFAAGTETSSTTIRWAVLYMIHSPEVQKRVHRELDDIVGTERMPTMEDKVNLPYTVATLQEIERMACVAPASLPKSNQKPAEFQGYTFPARSVFHLNIYAIHRDKKIWKEPEKFMPERFIDHDGKVFRPPQLLPFGSGKRACPGESLARMEIFLYFACLMQRYTFKPEDETNLPSLDAGIGFVRTPCSYQVRAVKRV